MTLTAGIAVVLTSVVLFPLFQSATWFFVGIGAVIAIGGAGLLSRRRTLPPVVCFLIMVVALLLYLNLVFEARRSWAAVIPTPGSMSALWRLMQDGFSESRKFTSPAPGLAGLTLLATTGVGITAVMTDLIAVRMRSVALAGLPLLVLFTVPSTFNASRGPLATGVIFCMGTIGYLSMLSADGRERIRIWGRLVSLWRSHEPDPRPATPAAEPPGISGGSAVSGVSAVSAAEPSGEAVRGRSRYQVLRGPDTRALAAAGRRVGFASVLVALCAPLLIPGLHTKHIGTTQWAFGLGNGSGSVSMPDPLAQTGTQLQDARPKTVFTYTTSQPASLRKFKQYLQMYVMTLTDNGWILGSGSGLSTTPVDSQLPPQGPGITNGAALLADTTITVPPGAAPPANTTAFLPAPFPPVRVTNLSGSWQVDPETLMLLSPRGSTAGMTYQVWSHYVNPSASGMLEQPPPKGAIVAKYTTLPAAYADSVSLRRELNAIIAGQHTTFDKADALTKWFDQQFTYNLFAAPITSPASLMNFLTRSRTGDCVQFAEAETIMLRMAGIPTRLAVGYTEGTESVTHPGLWVVQTSDAHAWPEVFFSGYGWVRFEPTTAGGGGTAAPPSFDQVALAATPGGSVTAPDSTSTVPKTSQPGLHLRPGQRPDVGVGDPGTAGVVAAHKNASTPWTAIAFAVLAAIALVCGIIAIVGPAGRRALAIRPGQAAERVRLNGGVVLVASLAGAGIIALALYRMLSRAHGLNLGAGWATVGIAFGATCAAALAVPTVLRLVLRRWRWVRAGSDEAKAHAAWLELCADLADYGVGHLPSESPRALAGRVRTGLALAEPAAEAVARIAMAEEHASYAGRPPESAKTLHRDGSAARRGIARATTTPARWRARLLPTSVLTAITEATGRIPATWGALTTRITSRLTRHAP